MDVFIAILFGGAVVWQLAWVVRTIQTVVATYYYRYSYSVKAEPARYWSLLASGIGSLAIGVYATYFVLTIPK